jgi:hypothetical protein
MENVGPDLGDVGEGVEIGAALPLGESVPDHYILQFSPSLYFGVALLFIRCCHSNRSEKRVAGRPHIKPNTRAVLGCWVRLALAPLRWRSLANTPNSRVVVTPCTHYGAEFLWLIQPTLCRAARCLL